MALADRYWSGIIDGIPLEDSPGIAAGFELAGAEAFDSGDETGNTIRGATGFPHTFYAPSILAGNVLELRFLHCPASLLRDVIDRLKEDLSAGRPCSFWDGFQTIEGSFKPDVPGWYTRGNPDGAYINDAVIRLICLGA